MTGPFRASALATDRPTAPVAGECPPAAASGDRPPAATPADSPSAAASGAPGPVPPPGVVPPHPASRWRKRWDWWCDRIASPALALVFPPRCAGCGEFESWLCHSCREALLPAGPDRCPRCGHPGGSASGPGWCPACVGQTPTFASARSAYLHEGPARSLVARFKYDGVRALGREMAGLAAAEFDALVRSCRPGAVTWVPAHPRSVRARGYNQAEVLARELGRASGRRPIALARKLRRTEHQQGLDREGRLGNLRGAFAAVGGERPPGEDVILVDDVFTTGATAAEVSSVLAGAWGVRVHVFTFSRTPATFPQRPD